MPFLEFEDIDKSFGSNNVLSKFNLRVEKGEFIVLLGPSGCGKSTLLRMIAGLEKINKGEIKLNGKLLSSEKKNVEPENRNISLSFQENSLFPHYNVKKNILLGI